MSINYHAYQNIEYLFTDYEEICRQWRERFTGYDPGKKCEVLGLKRDEQHVYAVLFGENYRLRLSDGILEKETGTEPGNTTEKSSDLSGKTAKKKSSQLMDDRVSWNVDEGVEPGYTRKINMNEAMAIYHLLHYTVDDPLPLTQTWIPNEHLDNRFRDTARPDPLFMYLTDHFSGRLPELIKACEAAGGTKLQEKGDAAYEFLPFPQVPLRLLYWDADDEFPAAVKILVNRNITDYVHMDTTGCLVAVLFRRLCGQLTD